MARCKGRNRAVYCAREGPRATVTVHDPERPQDMRELGRRGGSVRPQTALRQAADDDLREQTRDVLSRTMRGEKVDAQQLRAAQSLFSFRADQPPPRDPELGEYAGPLRPDGRRPTSLADVLVFGMTCNASTRAVVEDAIAQARAAAPPPGESSPRNPASSA